jgi:hypothetical protein
MAIRPQCGLRSAVLLSKIRKEFPSRFQREIPSFQEGIFLMSPEAMGRGIRFADGVVFLFAVS